ncbi:WHG domain-containing protein [Bosea sp. BK604]|uniref:TetR/AcrR family transcriptional regulator n=1 Tax=Bosea sp. BK604 TaxID=2512180 RepID=UPI001045D6A0|nr:WHG domain-containing protein [Bosea sp. BK604]TCR69666.1 TetR family transcriptional regulator [Bosea sp. BK604]
MAPVTDRRERQREALLEAAERTIAAKGLDGLKARELAREIGCAVGAIYNLVADLDELILRVGSRTLARLDRALQEAEARPLPGSSDPAVEQLVAVALAYCRFARANLPLWRTLFEHRMAEGSTVPEWALSEQMTLFRHIALPLASLMPQAGSADVALFTRTMFSAVHGVLALGLDEKLVAVPVAELERQIETLVRLICTGLLAGEATRARR